MAKARPTTDTPAPDQRKLTERQALRLGALATIDAKPLAGLSVAEISDKFKWQIDPTLLFFRRICGRVVKKDPVTGEAYPVPFATVHVEDTDCSLLGYFPPAWPWGWFFPLGCRREEIATVTTDRCGRFCVFVPRFEIDWILQWRRHRHCFPDIFVRPSIRDLLPPIDPPRRIPKPPFPPPPEPGPDPAPFDLVSRLPATLVEALAGPAGRALATRVERVAAAAHLGAPAEALDVLVDARAFPSELPPPLPEEFRKVQAGTADVGQSRANPADVIRSTIALRAGLVDRELDDFRLDRYIGPFFRCIDVYLPEWHRVVDVPDITFRVTQDVDGDGTEETIYGESYFDVRWNAGAIPDVTLVASSIARESHVCDAPDVPCGTTPAILFAGLMPLHDAAYFDAALGYAKRPNRPIPPSGPRPEARTPFLHTLQLYGCVNVQGAQFYRVLLSTDDGATFSAITGLHWNIYPIPAGPPHPVAADAQGWYPVLPNPDDFHPARLILEWPTPAVGKHVLKVEVGNAAKNPIQASAPVAIQVDNTAPTATFTTLAWKFAGEPDSAFSGAGRNLLVTCPTIRRGATPADIDVQMTVFVAATHLRDASIYARNCDLSGLAPLASPPPHASHWHDAVSDNSEVLTARYRITAADLEGAYSFGCRVNSRAMNPSGGDGGHLADWLYDPVVVYRQPEIRVAVVNA
ncbi:MAG: hypothetical protein R2752_05415 [Vicinamibacterales bacterium]